MPRLALTSHIDAPQKRAFSVFADLENAARNISGITRLEILTPGPIGKGTRFRETRIMFKREATETMEITEFDPPNSYAIEAESCGAHWRTGFRFVAEGPDRTRVEMETTIKAVTFMAKVMSPLSMLMMGVMRKCMEQDLADLKRCAEAAASEDGQTETVAPSGRSG